MAATGSAYSLNGYLNLLLRRSGKTILVEGVSDYELMHRLLAEGALQSQGPRLNVDQIALVGDRALSGMGNKDRILKVRNEATNLGRDFSKFATLVDREWDGLKSGELIDVSTWSSPQQGNNHYVTVGHSIENYHFRVECVISYLKYAAATSYTVETEREIREAFPNLLKLAVAYSKVNAEAKLIDKCGKLIEPNHVLFFEDHCEIHEDWAVKLQARGVDVVKSEQTLAAINETSRNGSLDDAVSNGYSHWLVHGHLGCNVIWAAVARIASNNGGVADNISTLARPSCQNRDKFWQDWISKQPSSEIWPLNELVDWAV